MGCIQGRSRVTIQNSHGKTEAQDERRREKSDFRSHEEEMGCVPCGEASEEASTEESDSKEETVTGTEGGTGGKSGEGTSGQSCEGYGWSIAKASLLLLSREYRFGSFW